jgi:predicted nucleic acid-binding Zn ribbon protein
MPISEKLVRRDTKNITCPKCGQRAKKIISPCSFELKGGGWYADGYSSARNTGNSTKPAKV